MASSYYFPSVFLVSEPINAYESHLICCLNEIRSVVAKICLFIGVSIVDLLFFLYFPKNVLVKGRQ